MDSNIVAEMKIAIDVLKDIQASCDIDSELYRACYVIGAEIHRVIRNYPATAGDISKEYLEDITYRLNRTRVMLMLILDLNTSNDKKRKLDKSVGIINDEINYLLDELRGRKRN